jgi:hypothetical protein
VSQKTNGLRFRILSLLGEGGVELIREFEQALSEERQEQGLRHPYVFTDKRAQAIAAAHNDLDVVAAAIHTTEDPEAHLALLKDKLAAKDAAYNLPSHEYDCALHHEAFISPARLVLIVNGYVDHDTEGNVTATKTFTPLAHLIFCPECKERFKL